MQFNVEWLKKWVAIDLEPEALAEKLTASGLEVDDIRGVAGEFSDVVVAEIEDNSTASLVGTTCFFFGNHTVHKYGARECLDVPDCLFSSKWDLC